MKRTLFVTIILIAAVATGLIGQEPGKKRTATIRTPENDDVRTLASYVFAVGTETPIISLPGVE